MVLQPVPTDVEYEMAPENSRSATPSVTTRSLQNWNVGRTVEKSLRAEVPPTRATPSSMCRSRREPATTSTSPMP